MVRLILCYMAIGYDERFIQDTEVYGMSKTLCNWVSNAYGGRQKYSGMVVGHMNFEIKPLRSLLFNDSQIKIAQSQWKPVTCLHSEMVASVVKIYMKTR
jgi:hypothetical protein